MTKYEQHKQEIETVLDAAGWRDFLLALSDVCDDKAAHCLGEWQDDNLALAWSTRGDIIDSILKPE